MSDLLRVAREGIEQVDVPDDVRRAAVEHLEQWLEAARYADYEPQIAALVEAARFEELVDAFRQVLPFGTGGRRGHVGVGPNRMNPHTVGTSVQGHAEWLHERFPTDDTADAPQISVVIAYDVRRFCDARGVYDSGRPSPLDGLSSRDLAELAARVYAANGIRAYMLPRGHQPLLSTPELSFAIRELQAQGGLNVSASHNPPDDNGVKVYDERGGQLVAPQDEALLERVSAVATTRTELWEDAVSDGLIRHLPANVHAAYVAETSSVASAPAPTSLRALYTPLHGTGVVHEVLRAAGYACDLHAPQATLDGAFPTVPDGVANPEIPAAMAHALAAARDHDLVFGTDPDADRLGCEVRHHGEWVHLTGNDIAVLVAYQACRQPPPGKQPLVMVTEVTTSLVGRVAEAAGAALVDDLLVGFKYIADGLAQLEQHGTWRGLEAERVALVAAAEESHGVLVTSRIRDKDAAGGAVVLASLAAEAKADGRTLVDVLEELRHAYGRVLNGQISVRYAGATGASRMAKVLAELRTTPVDALGGRTVRAFFDHQDTSGRFGPHKSKSDLASRNVLVYHLGPDPQFPHDDGARVILRPSGTEPKLKIYAEVQGHAALDDAGAASVQRALDHLLGALRARFGA